MAFRFRFFSLEDDRSTMRVGTDSMLLGAWANPPVTGRMLDIGTGCGILALMLAQKSNADIDAIEPDPGSFLQAKENFTSSPWPERIHARNDRLQDLPLQKNPLYDYIITNPPYYHGHLISSCQRKNQAKHQTMLSFQELTDIAFRLLKPQGIIALVLPPPVLTSWETAVGSQLFLTRRLDVSQIPGKKPHRILLEFAKFPVKETCHEKIALRDKNGKYSCAYLRLTREYHEFNR